MMMFNVLVIDDEQTYRRQISLILSANGYRVRTAADGQAGLDLARESLPDVLISDWRLSCGMTGLEVAEEVRRMNPQVRIIMITGYSAGEMRQQTTLDISRILEKPFGLEELLTAVREAVTARQAAE